jgi:hypothetical protein
MATETIIQKESPAVEAYKLGLMEKAKELIGEESKALPTLEFAEQSPLTTSAIDMATTGAGGFAGYIPQASETLQQGIGALGQAGQTVGQAQDLTNLALSGYAPIQSGALAGLGQASELGQAAALGGMQGIGDTLAGTQADKFLAQAQLMGTGGQFNPYGQGASSTGGFPAMPPQLQSAVQGQPSSSVVQGQPPVVGPGGQPLPSPTPGPMPSPIPGPAPTPSGIAAFFNPYEDQVVQQALADVQRASDIAGQGDAAQAVQAGAFGGSRAGIVEAERARNLMDQQGQLAGQLRQAGFGQAMGQAQKAFEDAQNRQIQKAQISGQLGAQAGQFGTLAGQQAGLGQLGQQMMYQDVDALTKLGAQQQQYEQAQFDQQQKENLQSYYQPYQKLGFYSDILQGAPTAQQTISQSTAPTPGMASQLVGAAATGIGLAGAANKTGII